MRDFGNNLINIYLAVAISLLISGGIQACSERAKARRASTPPKPSPRFVCTKTDSILNMWLITDTKTGREYLNANSCIVELRDGRAAGPAKQGGER
jgi:hypothetical protein